VPTTPGAGQHGAQFGGDPLRADRRGTGGEVFDGSPRLGIEHEAESGGEPHRPEHPQVVLAKTKRRHADGANDPGFEVGTATDMVVNFTRTGVHEQSVDGEVPPLCIVRSGRERHAGRVSTVGVGRVGSERGHLNLPTPPRPDDGDHPEGRPDRQGPTAAEQVPDSLGHG